MEHYCHWLWHTITVLSDGNVTCGLDDPHGKRSYGNVNEARITDILNTDEMQKRRENLKSGVLCDSCDLYSPINSAPLHERKVSQFPGHLVIEPTVSCNLRCPQASCIPNNDPQMKTRSCRTMRLSTFKEVIDDLSPYLGMIYFFNYGEAFLHPQSGEMLLYAREKCPDARIETSTNGIMLSRKSLAQKVVDSRIDKMTFTIGGASQETYEKYHVRGSLEKALEGMRNIVELKNQANQKSPEVYWRYLTFHWNDSMEEIARAKEIAQNVGVDTLKFHLTNCPPGSASQRLAPGQSGFREIAGQVDFAHGYLDSVPDGNGLYKEEYHPSLGSFQWTSQKATLFCSDGDLISLTSLGRRAEDPGITLRTPWETRRIRSGLTDWSHFKIRAPENYKPDPEKLIPIKLEIDKSFIPTKYGVDDHRILGVQVRRTPDYVEEAKRTSSFNLASLVRQPVSH